MRILQLTPGTGSFFCGSCLRDNALARALIAAGHDVLLTPLYLPFQLEDGPEQGAAGAEAPVRMGGINMYLQQKLGRLGRLPRFLARALDSPKLLRWASSRSNMTDAAALGEMTLSMLRGEEGRQAAELDQLVSWLGSIEPPDVVLLSNAMLIGLARRIKAEVGAPIVSTLQGEAPFLDALAAPYSEACWAELRERAQELDAFLAVSRYTADLMGERMAIPAERLHVVHNGIDLEGLEPRSRDTRRDGAPTIGYLARLCTDKGIDRLVDTFLELRRRGRVPGVRLVAGGVVLAEDRPLLAELERRIAREGASEDVEFRANLTREEKLELLGSIDVLSVPALYGESFGLYLLEAMACGVPVVEPRHGGLTEVVEATGGGLLFEADDQAGWCDALEELLLDDGRREALGAAGRAAVVERFQSARMASDVERICGAL